MILGLILDNFHIILKNLWKEIQGEYRKTNKFEKRKNQYRLHEKSTSKKDELYYKLNLGTDIRILFNESNYEVF